MYGLTVHQPYAWAIVHGGKTVENRSWYPADQMPFRLAIHAGKTHDPDGDRVAAALTRRLPPRDLLVYGAIVGVVTVQSVHWSGPFGCPSHDGALCSPWAEPNTVHWVLTDPEPVPPIPHRGFQRLWAMSPAAEESLIAAGVLL